MNRFVVLAATVGAALLLIAPGAQGFKPYTHNYTGNQARADAADGYVTITGRDYPVYPVRWSQALHDWPTYYNAGVVGPDGFPDLTMGQSVIHPVRHRSMAAATSSNRAWATQDDPSTPRRRRARSSPSRTASDARRRRHVGAHARQRAVRRACSPAFEDILTNSHAASIAIRHIIVEGYIGDATPGFDGEPGPHLCCPTATSATTRPRVSTSTPDPLHLRDAVGPNAAGAPSDRAWSADRLLHRPPGARSQVFVSGSSSRRRRCGAHTFRELEVRARRGERGSCSSSAHEHHLVPDRARRSSASPVIGDAFDSAVARSRKLSSGRRLV